jgi:hypothetical protein
VTRLTCAALAGLLLSLAAAVVPAQKPQDRTPAPYPFVFRDVGDETGLFPAAGGVRGHAAAWGDADGDGYPDLFLGTFHDAGSKTSQLLLNTRGKFRLDDQPALRLSSCASGALFADLTNSGRLDLYVSNSDQGKTGPRGAPNALFRNDGGGKFTDVSKESGACPRGIQGRSVAAADCDGDGLLDLLATDFYYTTKAKVGAALFRNRGGYRFEDVGEAVGLPRGTAVAGCAVADVNNDGWPDVFLTLPGGDNRLYLNDGHGKFREAPGTREVFAWKGLTPENMPTGVCLADLNRDGLPDIVVGHHFKAPWRQPAPVRLYLHTGLKDGNPTYREVTEEAGLTALAMKAPHVEIQDFDNDGWPDIFVSIVKFRDGKPYPVIFRNLGVKDGVPRFRNDAWAVNDFPTAADQAIGGAGPFFKKVLQEKKILYSAAAPAADFDRDGRMDVFLANWWTESRSLLLRNETPGGNWLQVQVQGDKGVNRLGIGSKVRVYPAGKLGDAAALLGCREIAVGYGWCSGQEALAHFGLGKQDAVDVEVVLPHGKGAVTQKNVKANQRITVRP